MTERAKRKPNLRLIGAVAIAILTVIVAIQNTATVETRLLFATVTMPRVLLLTFTLLIGFLLGLLAGSRGRRGEERRAASTEDEAA